MKIMILGGDGFCGWPTALKLAANGHEILIIDNLSRRKIDIDICSNSITTIETIENRIQNANDLVGNIDFIHCDITNYEEFINHVRKFHPDTIIHFAEQRAAPYSMISQKERRYTVDNNITTTHNVLNAIVDIDTNIHLIHLGTMGVYGYSKDFGTIPEGYLDVTINQTGAKAEILYPTNPGSVYHMTKSLDQIIFQFYNKNWNLKITDLHQGIVWGTQTTETRIHKSLSNRFDYDGIYGTVLNRFIAQAAADIPITVYGSGEQTRAFIHIEDTAKCILIACHNPPENNSKVRIFNQVSETKSIIDLANIISEKYNSVIKHYQNPRKELPANDLDVKNEGLKSLGFHPVILDMSLIDDVRYIAKTHTDSIIKDNILNSPEW